MSTDQVRAGSEWLRLREPADAEARSGDLVTEVRASLPTGRTVVVHDLGCGSGSMARWLARRLNGAQHWVMFDRDAELLALAAEDPPRLAADGAAVTIETHRRDITRLDSGELADTDLITASALLDMMTADELDRLVGTCAEAECPVLIALSVTGRVELARSDPFDEVVTDAFNAHQRRDTAGGPLLGPDAVAAAAEGFRRRGLDVLVRTSPWSLGPEHAALTVEWFTGWLGAACEQRPELAAPAVAYARRRLAEAAAGELSVTVYHQDVLARHRARPPAE
jgi:trans-aconitate methyltransferase